MPDKRSKSSAAARRSPARPRSTSPDWGPRAEYRIRTRVWLYPGMAGWHFANLPEKLSAEIRARFGADARGWGSLRVSVKIGSTEWRTSIFPDRKSRSYLFPIKAEVRKKEHIAAGDRITAVLRIV